MEYQEIINHKIGKLMTDEISAASMYMEAAQYIKDLELAEEIRKHAQEEFDHFKLLLEFAVTHSLKTNYDFDRAVIKNVPMNPQSVIRLIQTLEKKAIANYREIALLARENNDLESEQFFLDLMKAEMGHFDEVAQITGEYRKLGEGFDKSTKFREQFTK